jgi:hypothetical protein
MEYQLLKPSSLSVALHPDLQDDSHRILHPVPRMTRPEQRQTSASTLSSSFVCLWCIRRVTHASRNLYSN